jgi:hypothetical protein
MRVNIKIDVPDYIESFFAPMLKTGLSADEIAQRLVDCILAKVKAGGSVDPDIASEKSLRKMFPEMDDYMKLTFEKAGFDVDVSKASYAEIAEAAMGISMISMVRDAQEQDLSDDAWPPLSPRAGGGSPATPLRSTAASSWSRATIRRRRSRRSRSPAGGSVRWLSS